MDKKIYRAIDVNFNRSREGLRVCEELTRFILNNKRFSRDLKMLRREIEHILKTSPDIRKMALEARSVRSDVGRFDFADALERNNARDIFEANIQRAKEAVRALEEFFKLVNKNKVRKFKEIRFKIYDLEKKINEPLEALRNIR